MTYNDDYLFICLFAIYMSSLVRYLFSILIIFLVYFFFLVVKLYRYIIVLQIFSQTCVLSFHSFKSIFHRADILIV